MASRYLLDTNILIAALKGTPAIREVLENTPLSSLLLSSIVLGELEFGAEKSVWAERNHTRVAELTQRLPMLGVDGGTARQLRLRPGSTGAAGYTHWCQ